MRTDVSCVKKTTRVSATVTHRAAVHLSVCGETGAWLGRLSPRHTRFPERSESNMLLVAKWKFHGRQQT
jgi:hypothetical protein